MLAIKYEPIWRYVFGAFDPGEPAAFKANGIAVSFKEHRGTHWKTGCNALNKFANLGVIPYPTALKFGELCFTLANPRQEFAEFLIM